MSGEGQVLQIVDLIMTKLGCASSQVIPLYARHIYMDAWAYLILGIVILVALVALGVGVAYIDVKRKKDEPEWIRDSEETPSATIGMLIILVGLLIGGLFICNQVADIAAPQGAAIQKIIHDVRRGQ